MRAATVNSTMMRFISATSLTLATPAGLLLASIEAGGDEFPMNGEAFWNFLAKRALFTRVRGIGILRTSPFGHSPKFTHTELSEVRRFLGALRCFVPWSTYTRLRQEYAAFVAWPIDAARGRRIATCPPPRPGPATSPTNLACVVVDQAALHGLLRKVRDLGLPLISGTPTLNTMERPLSTDTKSTTP